ncbi:MAG: nickel insertion protein, partial [Verrucomicrobiota bacterium]
MRVLYFDCFSGISGDMTVGALRDLGVEEAVFHQALEGLGLGGEFHAHFHRGERQNIAGWKFDVHAHSHSHHEPHQHHGNEHDGHSVHGRSFREIRELVEKSSLSEFIKSRSVATFLRIAVAEGKIHGRPAEEVT